MSEIGRFFSLPAPQLTRYIVRTLGRYIGGATLILLLVIGGNITVRFLSSASEIGLTPHAVWLSVGLHIVDDLPVLLPLAVFIGTVAGLSMLWRTSEITAMQALGVTTAQLVRTTVYTALIPAVCVAVLTFSIAPWATRTIIALQHTNEPLYRVQNIAPNRFHRLGDTVLFANDSIDTPHGKRLSGVFFHRQHAHDEYVITARQAAFAFTGNTLMLTFIDGSVTFLTYDKNGRSAVRRIDRFATHTRSTVLPTVSVAPYTIPANGQTTVALSTQDTPAYRAEWHWRLALPIATLLLAGIGTFIARTPPRHSGGGRLLIAIIVYLLYGNLLVAGRSWLANDMTVVIFGLWWVHGILIAITYMCIPRTQRPTPLHALWQDIYHIGRHIRDRIAHRRFGAR